jgi:hypothetical protein
MQQGGSRSTIRQTQIEMIEETQSENSEDEELAYDYLRSTGVNNFKVVDKKSVPE